MHAFLLVQVVDYRLILAAQSLEALFASWIRKAAPIENKSAAVPRLVLRQTLVKRKTENAHGQPVCFARQPEQFFGSQHVLECIHQGGQVDGKLHVMRQPAQIFQRKRNALQKVRFPLVKTAKTIGAQGLHNAHVNVRVVVALKFVALYFGVTAERVEIVLKKMLTQLWRQIGLGVEEHGSDVVL